MDHRYLVPVYINCGGKSGSKTLEKTLQSHFNCLHTHGNFYFKKFVAKNDNSDLYKTISASMKIYENVYVIDSYRTPIERAVSSSFQNNKNTSTANFNYNLLIGENYSCLDEILFEYNLPLPEKFDFEKKYLHITHNNLHIIKLRLQDADSWGQILSNIFNKEIIIKKDNLSVNKLYYDKYKLFLENLKIPRKYFDSLINNKDFKMYNSEEDQKKYIQKWSNNIIDKEIKINGLPDDFDWKTYIEINKGRLQYMTELEVSIHYAQTGRFEGKKYSYSK